MTDTVTTSRPTLRASLSGTFLQKKAVVNQCLEFAADPHSPIRSDDSIHTCSARLREWVYELRGGGGGGGKGEGGMEVESMLFL